MKINYKERIHDLVILYKQESDPIIKDEIRDLISIYKEFKYK